MNIKTCKECRIDKNIEEFYFSDKKRGIRRGNCKPCHDKKRKSWEEKNKQHVLEHRKEYRSRADVKKRRCLIGKEWNRNNVASVLLTKAKKRAKELNVPFNLTKEDIIIPDLCPVLGIPLIVNDNIVGETSPTLDRILPKLGYVKGNVAVISAKANRIKNNASKEEIEKVLIWMMQQK